MDATFRVEMNEKVKIISLKLIDYFERECNHPPKFSPEWLA